LNKIESVNPYSFVNRDFYWVSEYLDGTLYPEYDFQTFMRNDFECIDRTKLIRFGYVGCGYHFYFDAPTGIFHIAKNLYSFSYLVGDDEYNLSCADLIYNDIISYKSMYSDANFSDQVSASSVSEYHFGYKTLIKHDDFTVHLKVIMHIPLGSPAYFTFHLVSNKTLNGKLVIRKNHIRLAEFDAPLEENTGGELAWNVEI